MKISGAKESKYLDNLLPPRAQKIRVGERISSMYDRQPEMNKRAPLWRS